MTPVGRTLFLMLTPLLPNGVDSFFLNVNSSPKSVAYFHLVCFKLKVKYFLMPSSFNIKYIKQKSEQIVFPL